MKKMSKFAAGLMCLATAGLVLAGCKKAEPAQTTPDTAPEVLSEAELITPDTQPDAPVSLGGYEWVTNNTANMMDEADSVRIAVSLRGEGTDFEVLDLVATQVVSGVNYMYLCYGAKEAGGTPGYYFVTIYETTGGEDSVLGIVPIDITAIKTAEPLGKGATGAWAVKGTGKAGNLPDEKAQASFDAINTGDVTYNPVALLATQLVSGMNYKALCRGNDDNLYVVTWYNDLDDNASLTSAECVDIGAYSGN